MTQSQTSRRVIRSATGLVLLMIVGTFVAAAWRSVGKVWVVSYGDEASESPLVTHERQVHHAWGKNNERTPRGLDPRTLTGRWSTCLRVAEPLDLPLQLVAQGEARMSVSGVETFNIHETPVRTAQGRVVHFEPGAHALRVEFESRGSRPAIALNASFDGKAPRPIPPPALPKGVEFAAPASADVDPCAGP